MNDKKWKSTGSERLDREITPFDLLDRWGRWVGYEIDVRSVSWEEAPETAVIWSTDPKPFVAFGVARPCRFRLVGAACASAVVPTIVEVSVSVVSVVAVVEGAAMELAGSPPPWRALRAPRGHCVPTRTTDRGKNWKSGET